MFKIAYQTITWRDDFNAALRDIAQAGYQYYETFSFPPKQGDTWPGYVDRLARAYMETPETYLQTAAYRTPEDIVNQGTRHGLTLTSMYCSGQFTDSELIPREIEAIISAARFLKTAGAEHIILGGGMNLAGSYTNRDYSVFFETLDTISRRCYELGVVPCYHPHSGTMVETREQLELLCDETDPSVVCLAPDTAHLVRGGADPVATIDSHADRIRYIHLKDIRDDDFVELGMGTIDLDGVVGALLDSEFTGPVVVELDNSDTPFESAKTSFEFLESRIK